MVESTATLRRHLQSVKPWAAVALILALGLATYYASQGLRYWQVSSDIKSLTQQQDRDSVAIRGPWNYEARLVETLLAHQQGLQRFDDLFKRWESDDMITLLNGVARDSGANLMTVFVGQRYPMVRGEIEYDAQPITLTLRGETASIGRFVQQLGQEASSAGISALHIGGLGSNPTAQVELLFYMSPRPLEEK